MRKRATTTQRGYGAKHRQARRNALAAWKPGDTCWRCGGILDGDPRHMDLGHMDGTAKQAYAGLEHRSCNRRAGQRTAAAIMRTRSRIVTIAYDGQPSRQW